MSWFTDLAGKAEDFLNQIDHNAANVLQKPKSGGTGSSPSHRKSQSGSAGTWSTSGARSAEVFLGDTYGASLGVTESVSAASNYQQQTTKYEQRTSGYASSVSGSLVSKPTNAQVSSVAVPMDASSNSHDDKLIEFLNDPATAAAAPIETKSATGLSRRSSSSSIRSLPVSAQHAATPSKAVINVETLQQKEPSTASYAITAELSELRTRETELQKALQSKESQLAILRVKLQESYQQLEAKTKQCAQLERDKQRLVKDTEHSAEFRNQAMDSLQERLKNMDSALEQERENSRKIEKDLMIRMQRLEEEKSGIMQDLMAHQKAVTEERLKARDAFDQLKLAKYNLEANKQEFDEYKQKAQRILQSKEKLIETLKAGVGGAELSEQSEAQIMLAEIQQERDLLREDLQQTQLQLSTLRSEIQELESQLAGEQRASLEAQRQFQEQAQMYQQSAMQYREQAEQLRQECQYLQDEMTRQQLALQTKLQQKDAEIERLTGQVASRSMHSQSDNEMETRIRSLTENLIQKQSLIESLQTERHSLMVQLERTEICKQITMQGMYREAEAAAVKASTVVNMGNGEDSTVHSRVPAFLRESPYDTGVARGVKRAYTTLDAFSARLGLFLRRYPIARVMVLVYMALLHAWVMVVLLTYSPEMHPPEYAPQPPPHK